MRTRIPGFLLAGAAIVAMSLNALPAQARDWHHGHGGRHWNSHYWYGGHHRGNGAGIALGLLGGALAGAAIASAAQPYYYSYSYPTYGYSYPGYGYYYYPY